ncbi:DUF3515 family protein [Kineococcus sp. LSe6-4]|uniref:DUF3515 family protein n=1 Tax=Kineococcus halophytocola TaxID=3234027 RepID=A0ABV4GX90_9ACTN
MPSTPADPPPGAPSHPSRPGRLVVGLVVLVVAAAAVWVYLAGSRGVQAAPQADDPACAPLLRALPQTLDGLGRTPQGAPGVAVWGQEQVVLRCGGLVLGPTTKACIPVGPDGGPTVDWVQDAANDRAVRFLTYGRTPAVEVTVRFGAGLARDQATSQLVDLAGPVAGIEQTRTCL